MEINQSRFHSAAEVQDLILHQNKTVGAPRVNEGASFLDILREKTGHVDESQELKFSKHALCRLSDRGITLSDEQMGRLTEGVAKAEGKGIQETLVLVDDYAFIVNVPNNTVVTAMDQRGADENIFTNIDGAVIM